ncbi:MAG TPA: DUF4339 domain-containing protein [bacterium]|nr:DUF4339 domain-containing protein [bacterium]
MDKVNWKVKKADGKVYGPRDTETIKGWIKENIISADDLLSPEGEEKWSPAREIPEFASLFKPLEGSSHPTVTVPSGKKIGGILKKNIMKKRRSVGITILSVTEMILGALGTASGIPLSIGGFLAEDVGGLVPFMIGSMLLIICGPLLIAGIPTFRLKPAGRILNLVLCFLLILGLCVGFIRECVESINRGYQVPVLEWVLFFSLLIFIIIAIPGLLIFYLTRPAIKEQFKK